MTDIDFSAAAWDVGYSMGLGGYTEAQMYASLAANGYPADEIDGWVRNDLEHGRLCGIRDREAFRADMASGETGRVHSVECEELPL